MKSQTGSIVVGSATDALALPANPRRTGLYIGVQLENTTAGSLLVGFGQSAVNGVAVVSNTTSGAVVHLTDGLDLDSAGDQLKLPIHFYWTGSGNKTVTWLEAFE